MQQMEYKGNVLTLSICSVIYIQIFILVYKVKFHTFYRLFSGIVPRVSWISIGGFIFFGVYEKSKALLTT